MSQITLTVPHVNHQSALVAVVLVAAAVVASILVEVYSRHYTKKQLVAYGQEAQKLGKAWTATLLTLVSAAFTYLGYLLFLAQSNTDYFSGLPFVGKHFTAVVGVGYFLYNLRLNKTYQNIAQYLSKWSNKKTTTTSTPVATEPPSVVPAPDDLSV